LRGGARRRRLDGAGRLGGGGKRRRGSSGEVRAMGSGLGAARGRGATKGGGYWGGAGLWWRLRGGMSSPGFGWCGGGVPRRGSEGRGKGRTKSTSGVYVVLRRSLEEAGGCRSWLSTATARWRPAGRFWKRRGAWQGKKRASARQQEGEEVVRDAWAPAHGGVMAGMAGKASAAALSVARTEQGGGRWS